ncbi:hypothetical protein Dsin_002536 [Dipteronia sinensis]|uniref:KIB1-4 beta-propeller domain-containing protein n=1 Tax=Dipteronia sinensis TaxID=43782 RepID=A0AAE0B797_9ROSI|nr:hypothetical protein Dsin_002536 [Dipteronia sinensis]
MAVWGCGLVARFDLGVCGDGLEFMLCLGFSGFDFSVRFAVFGLAFGGGRGRVCTFVTQPLVKLNSFKRESKQDCPPYLSSDIVGLLTSSSVCKSWKQVFDEIRHQEMEEEFLPWTLCFDWNKKSEGGTCKLCDPYARTSYIVKDPTERHLFLDAQLHTSRCGWLLFSKHNIFFLYSPFTNQIIKFPESESLSSSKATFSLNPTSPDFMVINLSAQPGKLNIKTCYIGDKSCKIFEFRGEEYEENCISNLAYAGGEFFYCLLCYTKLGAFNIKQLEWKVFPGQLPAEPCSLCVALNGDIVIPCLMPYDYYSSNGFLQLQWQFWRFDSSEEKWINGDEMMEKQVIFSGFIVKSNIVLDSGSRECKRICREAVLF